MDFCDFVFKVSYFFLVVCLGCVGLVKFCFFGIMEVVEDKKCFGISF